MKTTQFVLALIVAPVLATPAFAATTVPCEKMLTDVRAEMKAAKLSDADKASVMVLQDKGIERCNADDDARADGFFADAMKIMGK